MSDPIWQAVIATGVLGGIAGGLVVVVAWLVYRAALDGWDA